MNPPAGTRPPAGMGPPGGTRPSGGTSPPARTSPPAGGTTGVPAAVPAARTAAHGSGPAPSAAATARRVGARLAAHRGRLLVMFGCGFSSVALNVAGPPLMGHATDLIARGLVRHPGTVDTAALARTLLLALAVYLASGLCWIAQRRSMARIVQLTVARLRSDTEAKLHRLPLRYFDQNPRGDVLSRLTNDVDNLARSLQQTISQAANSLLLVAGVLSMMFWISPLLASLALVTVPVSMAATAFIGRRAQPHFARQWSGVGRLSATVEETYSAHTLVRLYGLEGERSRAMEAANAEVCAAGFRAQVISGMIQPVMALIGNLGFIAVAGTGGLLIASGSMSVGSVQAVVQYSRQFSGPLTQAAGLATLTQSGLASAARVMALLDEAEETPRPAVAALPAEVTGRLDVEALRFGYEPDVPVLKGISFHVEPGQIVALVGPTGAGKTTLVDLLMGFYEVDGGGIAIDGSDIAGWTRAQVREKVAMVLQEPWTFEGTIEQNIAYGRPGARREDVVRAARSAQADHLIRALPAGYATRIGPEGAGISAGERQLITLARAFLRDPAILVLDEATSSIDPRTEALVRRAMAELRRGRTCFVIAHRLATVQEADLILVMVDGRIVEQGRHEDLLSGHGVYARLHAAQFVPEGS